MRGYAQFSLVQVGKYVAKFLDFEKKVVV